MYLSVAYIVSLGLSLYRSGE